MADTGAQSAGTGASDSSVGNVVWTNPNNITSSDGNDASAVMSGVQTTEYLKCTNFGFNISSGSTIDGVLVQIERSGSGGDKTDNSVRLVVNDIVSGADRATGATLPASDAVADFGGSSDLWSLALSPSDVNASDFGVVYQAASTLVGVVSVDHVTITVFFTEPPSTTGTISQNFSSFSQSVTGTLRVTGTIQQNIGSYTQSATAFVPFSGTITQSFSAFSQSAIGTLRITGTIAQDFGPYSQSLAAFLDPGDVTQTINLQGVNDLTLILEGRHNLTDNLTGISDLIINLEGRVE